MASRTRIFIVEQTMIGKTKFNFWFDGAIFTAFVITAVTGLMLWLLIPGGGRGSENQIFLDMTRRTWIDIHNWTGLAMLIGVALHLILHWKWVSCVAARYFKKLAKQARLNFSLDSLLFVTFFLTGLSGLVAWLIVPGGGYQGGRNPYYGVTLLGLTHHNWSDLHLWASLAMMVIVVVHLALHWRWIACVTRRYAQAARCRPNDCAAA